MVSAHSLLTFEMHCREVPAYFVFDFFAHVGLHPIRISRAYELPVFDLIRPSITVEFVQEVWARFLNCDDMVASGVNDFS